MNTLNSLFYPEQPLQQPLQQPMQMQSGYPPIIMMQAPPPPRDWFGTVCKGLIVATAVVVAAKVATKAMR